jgi:hypothetical protein
VTVISYIKILKVDSAHTVKLEYIDHPRDPNLWPLLTGGRCSEVAVCYNDSNWDSKMVVVVGRWSLA